MNSPQKDSISTECMGMLKGGVFALGNFDGVHRGHQAVINAAVGKARGMGVPARVLTLEPHPRSVFTPDAPSFRLTDGGTKIFLLHALGIDDVVVMPFGIEAAKMPAEVFARDVLLGTYGAEHIVAGADYVFGHARQGNMGRLAEWLNPFGVGVSPIAPAADEGGTVFSSTRTREALRAGDVEMARRILGRPWAVCGVVEHGAERGRQIGVPTANIALGEYVRPRHGVYAVVAHNVVEPHLRYSGVANIGLRPTVDGKTELLEVHLFDFWGSIYGEEWAVELHHFLRPEQTFSGLEALKTQIAEDIKAAKAHFARISG